MEKGKNVRLESIIKALRALLIMFIRIILGSNMKDKVCIATSFFAKHKHRIDFKKKLLFPGELVSQSKRNCMFLKTNTFEN